MTALMTSLLAVAIALLAVFVAKRKPLRGTRGDATGQRSAGGANPESQMRIDGSNQDAGVDGD